MVLVLDRPVIADGAGERRSYLEENIAAADVRLSPAELEQIARVFPKGVAAGERYEEAGMQTLNL